MDGVGTCLKDLRMPRIPLSMCNDFEPNMGM